MIYKSNSLSLLHSLSDSSLSSSLTSTGTLSTNRLWPKSNFQTLLLLLKPVFLFSSQFEGSCNIIYKLKNKIFKISNFECILFPGILRFNLFPYLHIGSRKFLCLWKCSYNSVLLKSQI